MTDSQAELLPPNQILFRQAFTEINATVRYTYTRAGLEQDVILHEQPPPPSAFGLSDAHSRIEVISELTEDSPMPRLERRVLRGVTDPELRRRMVAPDLTDDSLDFGALQMGPGRAFQLPETGPTEAPVGKLYQVIDGRRILFESVPWTEALPLLNGLPRKQAAASPFGSGRRASDSRELPRRLVAKLSTPGGNLRLAQAPASPGLVLDFNLTGSLANFVFTNGVTYYVSGIVVLNGATVLQDAIVKFAPGGRLLLLGTLQCQTDAYAPAIFTARDDNTVGEVAPGSTGTPTGPDYADGALYVYAYSSPLMLEHVRIAYAKKAVTLSGVPASAKHEVRHAQLVRCGAGFNLNNTEILLRNVLMHEVLTNFCGAYAVARVEHATIHNAAWLNYGGACTTMALTNSILAGITNALGTYTSQNNHVAATEAGIFMSVQAGANYLPPGSSLRGAGTPNVHASFSTNLPRMTVDAPVNLTAAVTADTTWEPQAFGDYGAPDLGYH